MSLTKKVPKLRFPGFSDEWKKKKLSDLVEHKGGTALESFVDPAGKYKFISIGNYTIDGHYVDNGQRIDDLDTRIRDRILNKNDLVMVLNDKTTSGDIIGSTILVDATATYVYNQRSEKIVAIKEHVEPEFLWYKLNSRAFRKSVFSISQGGTQIYVNFPAVKKINIRLPDKNEQKKISGFLGCVDDKISALQQKKELLEKYKRGIIQKIFSQVVRFIDDNGEEYPDWDEKKLHTMTDIPVSDGPHLTPAFVKSGIPFLSVDNISNHALKLNKIRYITKQDHEEFSKKCRPQNGDILLGKAASVGQVAIAEFDGEFNVWSPIAVIRLSSSFHNLFFYYAFQTDTVQKQIKRFINSSSQKNIGMKDIKKLVFKVPAHEEQHKIADFLTSIDEKIETEERKLEQAKQFKKALLQQMLV